jgi:hypothetical protein
MSRSQAVSEWEAGSEPGTGAVGGEEGAAGVGTEPREQEKLQEAFAEEFVKP